MIEEHAEGELVKCPRLHNHSSWEIDKRLGLHTRDCPACIWDEAREAQFSHDETRYQKQISELRLICNRLMQENTELIEKLKGGVWNEKNSKIYLA